MNRKQRVVGAVAVGLVVLSGLFPAFEGEWRRPGDNLQRYLGHGCLLAPPSEAEVYQAMLGHAPGDGVTETELSQFSADVLLSYALLQIITVVVAGWGLILILADKKSSPSDAGAASGETSPSA